MASSKLIYEPCKNISRPHPTIAINKDIVEAIAQDYRTLPIFEKSVFEYNFKKNYSLLNNEYLNCRWTEYKKHIEDRVFEPFQFVDVRDYHFYNCRNRLVPTQSIHKRTDFRAKLRLGPGVDSCGQIPIPADMEQKRGEDKKHKEQSKRDSVTKKQNHEKNN